MGLLGLANDLLHARGAFAAPGTAQGRSSGTEARSHHSVQDWLPVRDVDRGLMVRDGGALVAVVRVEPAAFGLLSEGERDRRIGALHEAVQALPGAAQILVVPRPIDLDAYLGSLEATLAEAEGMRRSALRGYLGYVRAVVGGGEAQEHRYYVLLPAEGVRRSAREELVARAAEFVAALTRADLRAHLCDDAEILDLLYGWLHPAHAARERVEVAPPPAPRYVPEKG